MVSISKQKREHSEHLERNDKHEGMEHLESQVIKLQMDNKGIQAQLKCVQVSYEINLNIFLPLQFVKVQVILIQCLIFDTYRSNGFLKAGFLYVTSH